MARNKEIKVGVVVVVPAAAVSAALVFVGGVNLLRKKKVEYTTYFRFAGGLGDGQPRPLRRFQVRYRQVRRPRSGGHDSHRMLCRSTRHAHQERFLARISSLGFLGENYVEISSGTRDAARFLQEARSRRWKSSNWRTCLIM